jgi:predicted TIM-barrel fold metal-dependent hydrolase
MIDVHMHIYETKAQARNQKSAYSIVEYGRKDDVVFSSRAGDLEDALGSMRDSGVGRAVVLNLFHTSTAGTSFVEEGPGSPSGGPVVHDSSNAAVRRLMSYNEWICRVADDHPELVPFISVDPWIMDGLDIQRHIREMVEERKAKGVKIHPVVQHIGADDDRMQAIYAICSQLGIPILSHSGPGAKGEKYGVPQAFGPVLQAFPDLTLVLAHLGGGAWRQTADLAQEFDSVYFDCCEIISWMGAPSAPTPNELARLIKSVGVERVMMGSDFPWYELSSTVAQIWDLPILSQEEKELILGGNAERLLGI